LVGLEARGLGDQLDLVAIGRGGDPARDLGDLRRRDQAAAASLASGELAPTTEPCAKAIR